MAGLTNAGLEIKDLETLLGEIVADELANISASLNTEADSLTGQLNAIYAAAVFALWEQLEVVWQASFPSTASGNALSYLAEITGTTRGAATKAELTVRVVSQEAAGIITGSGGTIFYINGDPDSRWEIQSDVTTADLTTNRDISFTQQVGDTWTMNISGGGSTIYLNEGEAFEIQNRNAATNGFYRVTEYFNNSSYKVLPLGSQTITIATVNGDVVQSYAEVVALAETPGASTKGFGGDTTTIVDPFVDEIDSIVTIIDDGTGFPADYVTGTEEETDAELRTRRIEELATPGSATVAAIRADMLQIAGVDFAEVFENVTSTTDANGLPPYSIEVIVYSEAAPTFDTQEVVQGIWDSKPAGTETYGSSSGTATNSAGDNFTINYSTPTNVITWIELTFDYDEATYIGDENIASEILAWHAQNISVGDSVYASDIISVVQPLQGVVNVTLAEVDDETPTVSTDLILSGRQISTINPSFSITITKNPV